MKDDEFSEGESEPFGIENLLELARQIKSLDEAKIRESKRNLFFSHALYSYYDCICSGLTAEVGDIVYRLSDLLTEEERSRIAIYPAREGKAILGPDGEFYGVTAWDSLEKWRTEWKKYRPIIPELFKLLEPGDAEYLKDI